MAGEISLLAASLATVCIESFLYGIFFMLTILSGYLLVSRHNSSPTGKSIFLTPFFPTSILIFSTVTAHWILTFIRLFDAFINFESGTNPILYYADLRRSTEVVKTGFLMATLVIGDAMIIYRLWVVWNYNLLVVIFPCCTLLGLLVCGTGITYQFSIFPLGEDVFTSAAGRWITSDAVFTLTTNIYSTFFIAWRIWRINSTSRQFGASSLNSVLAIIVESAALYTSWAVIFMTSYLSESNMQFIAVDAFPAMAGISFMLIITRVGLGWAQKANMDSSTDRLGTGSRFNGRPSHGLVSDTIPMHTLAVNISKSVDRTDEYHVKPVGYDETYTAKSNI